MMFFSLALRKVYKGRIEQESERGGAARSARRAHNPQVCGSNPHPATRGHLFGWTCTDSDHSRVEKGTTSPAGVIFLF